MVSINNNLQHKPFTPNRGQRRKSSRKFKFLFIKCVVPESMHTSPMEGTFFKPHLLEFSSQLVPVIPPSVGTPWKEYFPQKYSSTVLIIIHFTSSSIKLAIFTLEPLKSSLEDLTSSVKTVNKTDILNV